MAADEAMDPVAGQGISPVPWPILAADNFLLLSPPNVCHSDVATKDGKAEGPSGVDSSEVKAMGASSTAPAAGATDAGAVATANTRGGPPRTQQRVLEIAVMLEECHPGTSCCGNISSGGI